MNEPRHDPDADRRARTILYVSALTGFLGLIVVVLLLVLAR